MIALTFLGCSQNRNDLMPAVVVHADFETEPTPKKGDVLDDSAIWINPANPYKSLIIGTNKKGGGLEVYDLSGKVVQKLADGKFNNVDLRYGMEVNGKSVDIVVTSNRTDDTLALYGVETEKSRLYPMVQKKIETLKKSYGLCMYQDKEQHKVYVFVNNKLGEILQLELFAQGETIDAKEVRRFHVGSQTEGCVADDEQSILYIGEENVGIWKYLAKPDAANHRVLIDSTENGHLTADVEGLALYTLENGGGYLIASSQGDNSYTVYDRKTGNYLGRFSIVEGVIDGTSETDGIAVTSSPIGQLYPYGMMVVQDGENTPSGRQNFKVLRIEKILGKLGLLDI